MRTIQHTQTKNITYAVAFYLATKTGAGDTGNTEDTEDTEDTDNARNAVRTQ